MGPNYPYTHKTPQIEPQRLTKETMAGKGDRYRQVDKKKYDKNYEKIFKERKNASTRRKN